jgi:hypothetical protein
MLSASLLLVLPLPELEFPHPGVWHVRRAGALEFSDGILVKLGRSTTHRFLSKKLYKLQTV